VRYRWTYVIDQRAPDKPTIVVDGDLPLTADTFITIRGPSYGTTFYTTDGTTPDQTSNRYTYPFRLLIPEAGTGSILVRAVSISPSGVKGEEVSALIPYDRDEPEAPVVRAIRRGQRNGSFEITAEPDFGCKLIYEIAFNGSIPADPDARSPIIGSTFTVSMPYGMDGIATLKLASRDSAGNVSAPTETLSLPIDLCPPSTPIITVENDRIVITGEASIFYTISTNGSPLGLPTGKSRVYTQPIPLPLKEGELNSIAVQARSMDAGGNYSDLAGPFLIQRDLRTPSLPPLTSLLRERLYNAPVSIPIPPASFTVRYEVTTDGSDPPDPVSASPKAEGGRLVFEGREGATVPYAVKIAPFTGESRGRIDFFRFTIDREAPEMPVPVGFPESGVVETPVKVMVNRQEGILLYRVRIDEPITISEDRLFAEENLWNGEDTLTAVPGQTVTAYFFFGAEDAAGNRTFNPKRYTVRIDRTYPEVPSFHGLPERMITSESVRVELRGEGSIRYEVTSDGSLPRSPRHARNS
jgi:hypothetical protein